MNFIRKIIFLLLSVLPLALWAQRVPDNDVILAKTIDADSPYFYPSLELRYNNGDTTLTVDDYHYLYYGYAYSDDYKPLNAIPAVDKILMILEKNNEPDYDQMLEIIRYAKEVMKADPFSPSNLNFLTYAYGAIGDAENERINYDRMTKILEVIDSSGAGLKEGEPKHILMFSHAIDLLVSKELEVGGSRVVSKTVEYVSLIKPTKGVKGYFFDYSRIYWQQSEEAPKKERRWMFNNVKL